MRIDSEQSDFLDCQTPSFFNAVIAVRVARSIARREVAAARAAPLVQRDMHNAQAGRPA